MLALLRRRREDRRLARLPWPDTLWENNIADWPVAARYQGAARRQLHGMAMRFLMRKHIASGGDMKITDEVSLRIATMAAVPVLELGLDWYRDFSSVIVYAHPFVPPHEQEDEYGVVHVNYHPLGGEAWPDGPVILSWEDVLRCGRDGYNVVIHEFAHKLDMRHDGPNGAPPLHADMDPGRWQEVFTAAWEDLERAVEEEQEDLPVDPYALEDAGEFFAVTSEAFFETPRRLQRYWPGVYEQLSLFYRQQP